MVGQCPDQDSEGHGGPGQAVGPWAGSEYTGRHLSGQGFAEPQVHVQEVASQDSEKQWVPRADKVQVRALRLWGHWSGPGSERQGVLRAGSGVLGSEEWLTEFLQARMPT